MNAYQSRILIGSTSTVAEVQGFASGTGQVEENIDLIIAATRASRRIFTDECVRASL